MSTSNANDVTIIVVVVGALCLIVSIARLTVEKFDWTRSVLNEGLLVQSGPSLEVQSSCNIWLMINSKHFYL